MEKLPDKWLLSSHLEKNDVSAKNISDIATRIAEIHEISPAKDKAAESGKAESFRALCDDMLFQMKRYFEASLTQPILDMIRHPLEKFIDQNKRLFSKRQQKGRVVFGHGAFLPEHIFVSDEVVRFISPQEVHRKLADLDVADKELRLFLHVQPFSLPSAVEVRSHNDMNQRHLRSGIPNVLLQVPAHPHPNSPFNQRHIITVIQ